MERQINISKNNKTIKNDNIFNGKIKQIQKKNSNFS